jgi:hypothetical protein
VLNLNRKMRREIKRKMRREIKRKMRREIKRKMRREIKEIKKVSYFLDGIVRYKLV